MSVERQTFSCLARTHNQSEDGTPFETGTTRLKRGSAGVTVRRLSEHDARRLLEAHRSVDHKPAEATLEVFAERIATILSTTVAFLVKRDRGWSALTQFPHGRSLASPEQSDPTFGAIVETPSATGVLRWSAGAEVWTLLRCGSSRYLMAIQGDWTEVAVLSTLASNIGLMLRARAIVTCLRPMCVPSDARTKARGPTWISTLPPCAV